jgi:hypothetical protein
MRHGQDIRAELRDGRRCQVYATFTGEFDVAARLETVLRSAGFRVAVLRSTVATLQREEWYERQLKHGVDVVICHPKLVETGLDLLAFSTLYFYETGYSLHTLRQASRRSWRIGQHHPVRVKFLVNKGTTQTTCLRLMGKKMLVALMMEGKFSGEGIHSLESDDDLMSAMARELVERGHVGESADAVWADLKREPTCTCPAGPRIRHKTRSRSQKKSWQKCHSSCHSPCPSHRLARSSTPPQSRSRNLLRCGPPAKLTGSRCFSSPDAGLQIKCCRPHSISAPYGVPETFHDTRGDRRRQGASLWKSTLQLTTGCPDRAQAASGTAKYRGLNSTLTPIWCQHDQPFWKTRNE